MPPLPLLPAGLGNALPYSSAKAMVACATSSNSTKHMGPWLWLVDPAPALDSWFLVRKDNLRKPFCGANKVRSSASVASGGKLPTYNVLQGGFWSAGLAGGGTLASKDKSGTSFEDVLGALVGVVADAGCEELADRLCGAPIEPDAEDGPLLLRDEDGMVNRAKFPLF